MSDLDSIQQVLAPLFPGLMGLELLEGSPTRVVGRLVVRPELCTVGDILHGGAVMAFADTLGAVATVLNMTAGRTTTIESSTKFLGASPVGTTLIGECTPFHRGRTTQVWQTLIKSEDGKLRAVVTQTQLVMQPREP